MTPWRETIAPDEEARFNGYAAEIRAMQKARAARVGSTGRGLHTKAHVGAVGHLTVGALPQNLAVGPFAKPGTWPLYARFSNGTGDKKHDGAPDIRGIALKLVGVPGKKLIPGLTDKLTQDFLLIQTPTVVTGTPEQFLALVRAVSKGQALLLPRLIGSLGFGKALSVIKSVLTMPKVPTMALGRFYTAAPIRFGENAAKLDLVPLATDPTPAPKERDGLRTDLVRRLMAGPIEYTLRAQLFVDEATTPIEDASVLWPESRTPFIELGRVTLPRQDVNSPRGEEIEKLVESLSFDPWHAVEELRPLGAIMRARGAAYRDSVIERKAADEPESVLSL